MKELNTKIGVYLTTYTQVEIDIQIEEYMDRNDSKGCIRFMDDIRSFNPESNYHVTEKEAKRWTGLEKRKSKKTPHNMYTNYKGAPFGLHINESTLYFIDPILSLKSAFEIGAPTFDFKKDFFHIRLVK